MGLLTDSVLWDLVLLGGGLFGGMVALLYVYQDRLLYFPNPMPELPRSPDANPAGFRSPRDFDLPFENIRVPTRDGERVHCWLVKQTPAETARRRPTLVFFHGNAGNMGFRLPNAEMLYQHIGVNLMLVDYRGYGNSTGKPSEAGLKEDGRAVVQALCERDDIDSEAIVLFGRSLGGAVATATAAAAPHLVHAIVLENTFLSISAMVDVLMPAVRYLKGLVLRIGWDSEKIVPDLTHAMLFISGTRDELVPPPQMHRLHKLAERSTYRKLHSVKNGTHNDTWQVGGLEYYAAILDFLVKVFPEHYRSGEHVERMQAALQKVKQTSKRAGGETSSATEADGASASTTGSRHEHGAGPGDVQSIPTMRTDFGVDMSGISEGSSKKEL